MILPYFESFNKDIQSKCRTRDNFITLPRGIKNLALMRGISFLKEYNTVLPDRMISIHFFLSPSTFDILSILLLW